MRTPNEMFELMKKVAYEDDNILAVYYGGSRANPTITPDIFQDYDVVFVVKEVEPYWMLGVRYEGSISSGKLGKFYKKYLSKEEYALLCKSFPSESYDSFWSAIDSLIELFLYAAHYVADKTTLSFCEDDAVGLVEYLNKVKNNEYHY